MMTITPVSRHGIEWRSARQVVPEPLHDVLAVWYFDGDPSVDVAYRKPDGQWVMTYTELPIEPRYWSPLPAIPAEAA